MKEIHSDVIQFRGSHFDFGVIQGEQIKDSLIVENRKKQWQVRRPKFRIEPEEAKRAICAFAPGIWEELLGLQEALKWPLKDILQDFGGYRTEYKRSGCSTITGADYLIRNYDYHPKTYEGRYTLFQPTDQGYAIIGPSQRICGRMDGMNEHGLAMGYNFMHRKKPGDGFICHAIGRMILETCRDAEEAVQLLKEIPHRHSFSYIVFDREGRSYVVEATPRDVVVRKANRCTNHFETLQHENRKVLDDSRERMAAINRAHTDDTDAYKAFRLLNDTDQGVFSDQYHNWSGTIHTSAYFPKTLKAWFALGGDRDPVEMDFAKWLAGEDFPVKRLYGQVETDLGFVHMDENVK